MAIKRKYLTALALSALFIGFVPTQVAFAASCTINGTAGNDLITGTSGNDVICLGAGNDTVNAGDGNDTIIKGSGTATINSGLGNDTIDASLATSVTIDAGAGDDVIIGSSGNDNITLGDGMDDVEAGDGNDIVTGGSGDDSIDGGLGDNTLSGGAGDDTILGDEGKDTIYGDAGDDTIDGGDEADTLNGGTGDDTLIGGIDNDLLYGNEGNDILYGDAGDDQLFGQAGTDTLSGQQGDDLLRGGLAIDSLNGGIGTNICDFDTGEKRTTTCEYEVVAPVLTLPGAPTDLVFSEVISSGFKMAWSAPVDTGGTVISNYVIEASTDGGSTWAPARAEVSPATQLVLSGSQPGTSYQIRIAATNSVGSSTYLTGSIKTALVAASAPSDFVAKTVTSTSISLSWTAPSFTGGSNISNYLVEMSSDSGSSWTVIPHATSILPTITVPSLIANKSYLFRVSAITGFGTGSSSANLQVSTPAIPGPQAPSNFKVSAVKTTGVALTWVAPVVPSYSKITNYLVDLSLDGKQWVPVEKKVATTTSISISNLRIGTTYQVRISAVSPSGTSAYLFGTFKTLATAPLSPTSLNSTDLSSTSFTLNWNPAFDGGSAVTNYVVEINGGGYSWATVPHSSSPNNSLVIQNLQPAVKYSVRVKAVNSVGVSKVSSTLNVVTLPSVPGAPVEVIVKSSTAALTVLTWKATATGGAKITDYRIKYSTDQGQTWLVLDESVSTATTLSIRDLKPKTSYWFTVSAKNSAGYSGESQVLRLSTP